MIDINLGFAFGMIVLFIVGLFSLTLWMLNRGIGLRTFFIFVSSCSIKLF